jgi:predicted nucleic acid-binding protein
MILVDTSVWSETTKAQPNDTVLSWLREHQEDIALNAITVGELLAGVRMMPDGRRRDQLAQRIDLLSAGFGSSIYAYDARAARAYAGIRSSLRRAGREAARTEDAMIAAIAISRGFSVATRNTGDFAHTGASVINPWM